MFGAAHRPWKMRPLLLLVGLLIGLPALGKQTAFDLDKGAKRYQFEVSWRTEAGPDQVAFQLPAGRVQRDLEFKTGFPRRDANTFIAEAVRAWARSNAPNGVQVMVKVQGGGVQIGARGRSKEKIRKALKGAVQARDAALAQFLEDNDFFRLEGDTLSYDHPRLVEKYASDVRPLAQALQAGTESREAFLARSLAFVQSIPYEQRKRTGADAGYRRPLALLARNRGDCDSKAVLYLALVKAAYPDIPSSVVYIPGHAFVGLGVQGDGVRFEDRGGVSYLLVEPVGPALAPLGDGSKKSMRRARRGRVIVKPVG